MNKKVLIISYVFPPYPGIGGRRWAKFAKYLTRRGWEVHVICARNPFGELSLWSGDAGEILPGRIHLTSPRYPSVLLRAPQTFLEKIYYRLWIVVLKIFSAGTIYDRALWWKKIMLEKAEKIIAEGHISNVIVSGAPFRSMYYAALLKKKKPGINLLADFRDPWTEGSSYGFARLSSKRFRYESSMEKEVVRAADHITAPAPEIMKYLEKKYQKNSSAFTWLPHGFDPDEIPAEIKPSPGDKIRFIYAGALYEELEKHFNTLCSTLLQLQKNNRLLFEKIRIDIYSSTAKYKEIFPGSLAGTVRFYPPLAPPALLRELAQCDYVLITFIDKYRNYISTKFYEILKLRRPVIYLGPPGKASEFITCNNMGVHLQLENFYEGFTALLDKKQIFYSDMQVNPDDFSFEKLTARLESLLVQEN